MIRDQLFAIAPILALSGGAVLLMLLVSWRRNMTMAWWITNLTLLGAAATSVPAARVTSIMVTPLLAADNYALFFSALFCLCALVTSLISHDYLAEREGENDEFFLLLLLSTLGAVTLAYASHFASLLLGMELLGVALYALIGYPDRLSLPLEAAIKYLVLSGAASATLVFGFALLYAGVGNLDFAGTGMTVQDGVDNPILLAAATLIIAGLGFKLSVVPFHMWTPDVYEGAPAPISGFLASVSKAAVFVALLRWWMDSGLHSAAGLITVLTALACASMLIGNLLALLNDNIKRVLGYSSIAHMGYLVIVLIAVGAASDPSLAMEAAAYFLVAYTVTVLAAFTLLALLSRSSGDREIDQVNDLSGLFWREPGLSLLFTVALLSMAGIPLTAGFIGKFYLFATGVESSLWVLLAFLVLGSGLGIYYYLRMVFQMTRAAPENEACAPGVHSWPARLTCYALIGAMLLLGTLPEPLMELLRSIL